MQLEPNLPQGHAQLGFVLVHKREHEASMAEFERATPLNPNFMDWFTAVALVYAGEPARPGLCTRPEIFVTALA